MSNLSTFPITTTHSFNPLLSLVPVEPLEPSAVAPALVRTTWRRSSTDSDLWSGNPRQRRAAKAPARGTVPPNRFAPDNAQCIFDAALQHHLAGRLDEAIAQYTVALSLCPDYARAHNNLGVALVAMGRIADAIVHYEQALTLDPDDVNAHNNLGIALAAQGRVADAISHHERALALNPGDAAAHYNLGLAYAALDRIAEAVASYQRAVTLRPGFAEAHNNLANLFAADGDPAAAIPHYRRAIAIRPDHADAHNNLGNTLRDRGEFRDARVHYDRAIAIRPDHAEAHFHRAQLKTFRLGDADLSALQSMAARDDLPATKVPFVHFALAKALEDCGDYARAFRHLRRGNDAKRRQIHYSETSVAELFERIRSVFDRRLLERSAGTGHSSSSPIFILGMPRSGSTLIEQILASHPDIHGAGERTDLQKAVPPQFPECVTALDAAALHRIAENYLTSMPALSDGKIRIVNKLPDNFMLIGLIRLILPNARIIHSVRNPIDTCVSCYSQLFASGQHFSYDLAELGRYYRRYNELMTHWRAILPPDSMLDVTYENVVDDLEGESRRLIDYCGLAWDDRCLSFHKTNRVVQTASAVQVRQPLYRDSPERWRRFEAGLGPLLQELGGLIPAPPRTPAIGRAA